MLITIRKTVLTLTSAHATASSDLPRTRYTNLVVLHSPESAILINIMEVLEVVVRTKTIVMVLKEVIATSHCI